MRTTSRLLASIVMLELAVATGASAQTVEIVPLGEGGGLTPPPAWRIRVDHWQAGGRQESGRGRARPFKTGLLGFTRYAADGDSEIRVTVGAGGGVKVSLARGLGVRLDTRLFTTFVDAEGGAAACAPGICFVALNVDVLWQLEFSAGLVLGF